MCAQFSGSMLQLHLKIMTALMLHVGEGAAENGDALTPANQEAGRVLFAGHNLLVRAAGSRSILALAPRAPAAAHLSLLGNDRILRLQQHTTQKHVIGERIKSPLTVITQRFEAFTWRLQFNSFAASAHPELK